MGRIIWEEIVFATELSNKSLSKGDNNGKDFDSSNWIKVSIQKEKARTRIDNSLTIRDNCCQLMLIEVYGISQCCC